MLRFSYQKNRSLTQDAGNSVDTNIAIILRFFFQFFNRNLEQEKFVSDFHHDSGS